MATIVLGSGISQQFPVGTSVGAYPRSAKNPGGAPAGAAVESVAVAAGGTLTYTLISRTVPYTAYALVSGQHRYVDFMLPISDIAVKRAAREGIKIVEATVDIGSIAGNAVLDVNVPVPAGTCKPGDVVVGGFNPVLAATAVVQGVGCVTVDSIRVRVQNTHASAAVDPASASLTFVVIEV